MKKIFKKGKISFMKWPFKRKTEVACMLAGYVLGAACVGSSLGFFTSQETVENVFTVGDLDISLEEPEWDPEEGDGQDVCPGYTVYKNPTVKNITVQEKEQPCYVQMRVWAEDENGALITDEERLELIRTVIRYDSSYNGTLSEKGEADALVESRVPGYSLEEIQALPMVNPDFTEVETGIVGEWLFRYTGGTDGTLAIGEEATLFTTLAIPTDWKNAEAKKLGDLKLQIKAEAIQAYGFASAEDAFAVLADNLEEEAQSEEEDSV